MKIDGELKNSSDTLRHAINQKFNALKVPDYLLRSHLQQDSIDLTKLGIHPWPATWEQFKKEFMEVKVEDPMANLDLHLPSPEELRNYAYPCGGIRMQGPISYLYDQFSREARSKKTYADLMIKEKVSKRYNKEVVAKVTGMTNEDEIKKFMEFCALQIQFILESTDYELYAAIMNCYSEFCKTGGVTNAP
jgi:hypothetical protein